MTGGKLARPTPLIQGLMFEKFLISDISPSSVCAARSFKLGNRDQMRPGGNSAPNQCRAFYYYSPTFDKLGEVCGCSSVGGAVGMSVSQVL